MDKRSAKRHSLNQSTSTVYEKTIKTIFTDNNYTIVSKKIQEIEMSDSESAGSDDVVLIILKEDKTSTDCDSQQTTKSKGEVPEENKQSNGRYKKKVSSFWKNEELIHDIKTMLEINVFQENEDFEKLTERLTNKAAAVRRDTKVEQYHDDILKISEILQVYIHNGITAVYIPETNTIDSIKIKIAANSCLTMLHLLWASDIFKCSSQRTDERMLMLKNVVDFTKNQIRTSIIPEFRNSSNKVTKQNQNIKLHLNQITLTIYQNICEIVSLLSQIIEEPEILNDYCTTSLVFTVFGVFQTKYMFELHTVCLQLVAKIFSHKSEDPDISKLITRELLSSNAPQINEDYNTLNQYKPHLYTALVLQIIQSKCYIYGGNGNAKDTLNKAIGKQLSTTKFCSEFIRQLLEISVSNSEGFKSILKAFLGDLIVLCDKPEWPAAAYVIQELCDVLNDENAEDEIRNVCMDFVPQIVVKLKSIFRTLQNEEHLKAIFQPIIKNRDEEMVFRIQNHILDFLEYDSNRDDVYYYALFFNMTLWLKNNFIQWNCTLRNAKGKQQQNTNKKSIYLKRMNKIMNRLTKFNTRRKDNDNNKNVLEYKKASRLCQCIYFGFDLLKYCEQYVSILRKAIVDGNSTVEISRALKGAILISERFPNTFSLSEINDIVNRYALDTSVTIKGSVINLLGKYLVGNPELTDDSYYKLLCEKLCSEDVTVRKYCIDIFKKIHGKIPNKNNNLYLHLAKFHEDPKISKSIIDIFQEKWFCLSQDLLQSLVEIVKLANNLQLKQIRSIFVQLYNLYKQSKNTETKTIKAVNNAITTTLNLLHSPRSDQCVPYLIVLHMITKANCTLMSKFAKKIHGIIYFNLKSYNATKLLQKYVIKIIKLIIPVIAQDTDLINEMEIKLVRALGFLYNLVIKSCMICLAKLVQYTQNCEIIVKVFWVNYNSFKNIENNNNYSVGVSEENKIKRSLLLVGLLLHIFNFEDAHFISSKYAVIDHNIVEEVFQLLIKILKKGNNNSIKTNIIECLGLICVKYDDFLMNTDFQNICLETFKTEDELPKLEILKMFKCYLHRQTEIETYSQTQPQDEIFKDNIRDGTLGKPSTIIQTFVKNILRCGLSTDLSIRLETMEIIKLIRRLGCVHPVEIIPFLICMSCNIYEISHMAQSHLSELQLKYPHLINTQYLVGIMLTFEFNNKIGGESHLTRGLLLSVNGQCVNAVNDFLYKLIQHSKRQWREFILKVLKQFDENLKHDLEYLIFLADNLSAFSYKTLDEVYFTIYYINELSIQYGAITLQTIRNTLRKKDFKNKKLMLELLSNSIIDPQFYIYKFRVYSLLLQLKKYLMKKYSIKDADIRTYSPSILLKTNENVIGQIKYKPFAPDHVVKACLNEKNKQDINIKETFFKELCVFEKCIKIDLGDEEEDTITFL